MRRELGPVVEAFRSAAYCSPAWRSRAIALGQYDIDERWEAAGSTLHGWLRAARRRPINEV